MIRRDDRNNRSPILRDAMRGSGGLGSGWFTTNGSEGLPFDPTSSLWGTESGELVVTDTDAPISTS